MAKAKKRALALTTLYTHALFLLLTYTSFDPFVRYIPLSANRSAKRTATKAQQGNLLGLCLLTVAAIVNLAEKEKHL